MTTMMMIHMPQRGRRRRDRRRRKRQYHRQQLLCPTSLSSSSSFLLFFLFICFISCHRYLKVVESIQFEPFIVQWCVEQFPNQLIDNENRIIPREAHHPIEMFLGGWCFEQYPNDFETDNAAAESLIVNLNNDHIAIEIYLNEWGQKQQQQQQSTEFELQQEIIIEPYVGEWCGEQFNAILIIEDDESIKFNPLFGYLDDVIIIPIEKNIGEWCFASYPTYLGNSSNLDQSIAINQLESKHIEIEKFVEYWYGNTTTTKVDNNNNNNNIEEREPPKSSTMNYNINNDDVVIVFLFIIISIILLGVLVFVIRSKQQQQQQQQQQQHVNNQQQQDIDNDIDNNNNKDPSGLGVSTQSPDGSKDRRISSSIYYSYQR